MMFAPGWRNSSRMIPGLPLTSPSLRRSSTEFGDLGDVGEMDRRAVAIGDHEGTVIGGEIRLIVGVDLQMQSIALDRAFRAVGVGGGERRAHVLEADAIFRKGVRVDLHAHRRQRGAADGDLTYAVKLRKPLLQNIAGRVVHLPRRQRFRRQVEEKDRRVGGVDLAVDRVAAQARRQIGVRRVDRSLNIARRAVDVAVEVELKRDSRASDGARRRHFGDGGDAAECALKRTCDAGGDRVGTCPGQRRLHGDRREIDFRQWRNGQSEEGEGAGERNSDGDQSGRHRPRDEGRGKVHSALSPARAPAGGRPRRRAARRSK